MQLAVLFDHGSESCQSVVTLQLNAPPRRDVRTAFDRLQCKCNHAAIMPVA